MDSSLSIFSKSSSTFSLAGEIIVELNDLRSWEIRVFTIYYEKKQILHDFFFCKKKVLRIKEAFKIGCQNAVDLNCPFISVASSGGARMQEGIVSLMQLPKTVAAVNMLDQHKIPYISVLTHPTTGGVSASFAMLGDIIIAEKGSMIGFAGKRVIEETIKEQLPEDFQTAEYLLEHGMIDMVVHRKELNQSLSKVLSFVKK